VPSATYVLNSAASSPPLPVTRDMASSQYLAPSILCLVSPGASLTYSIEVTGDAITAAGYSAASGNWFPFTGMAGLTASANATLGAYVTGIRARISTYASGTLTMQVVWGPMP
jgi:hypothetical protein